MILRHNGVSRAYVENFETPEQILLQFYIKHAIILFSGTLRFEKRDIYRIDGNINLALMVVFS